MNAFDTLTLVLTTLLNVVESVLPLLVILVLIEVYFLRLDKNQVLRLVKGTLISAFGLFLFLLGVQAGFLPFGQAIGKAIGNSGLSWLVIPVGTVLGFLTAWSEPAVRILCDQVEETSSGAIRKMTVLFAICTGVAFFVALGMARIVYGIPLLYITVPGYSLAILMLRLTDKDFLGVAFDAGGVATGPITNTFLLGIGLGLGSVNTDNSPIIYGLGLIALVALAPIISVMALGIFIRFKPGRRT